MGLSVWQILIIVLLIVLLFGRGKISDLLGDLGRGITSFKSGLKEGASDDDESAEEEDETKAISSENETVIEGEVKKEREQA